MAHKPIKLSDMAIVDLAERLINLAGTDEEEVMWVESLENSVPGMIDLLFHDPRQLSPTQALHEARKRKSIILGPGSDQTGR